MTKDEKKTEAERVKHVQMGKNKGNKGARGINIGVRREGEKALNHF
jgi:hypothetical protein